MDDIYVNQEIRLPRGINEFVAPCNSGYMIYLDRNLSYHGKIRAYKHALKHIRNGDFNGGSVQEIERKAHK